MRSSGRKTKQPRIFADRNRAKTKNGIHLRETLRLRAGQAADTEKAWSKAKAMAQIGVVAENTFLIAVETG